MAKVSGCSVGAIFKAAFPARLISKPFFSRINLPMYVASFRNGAKLVFFPTSNRRFMIFEERSKGTILPLVFDQNIEKPSKRGEIILERAILTTSSTCSSKVMCVVSIRMASSACFKGLSILVVSILSR